MRDHSHRAIRSRFQQRSAGFCDDATNAVANPLQQRPLQQRLLQQRSVRQRTAATCRNPVQQRIACCNSAHYHNTARCTTAQSDATEHRVLQQSTILSLHSATRRRSCCGSAVQRCSLFCNSVAQQGNRFQCRAVSCSRPRPAVADHSPLQPAVAIATQRSSMFTVCHKQQHNRLQRSATGCNPVSSVATDHTSLKPVAAIATQRRQHGHSAPQHRSTTGCNAAHPVATQCRPLQQTSLR